MNLDMHCTQYHSQYAKNIKAVPFTKNAIDNIVLYFVLPIIETAVVDPKNNPTKTSDPKKPRSLLPRPKSS